MTTGALTAPATLSQVSTLLARYVWAIDDREWDELRRVFTADVAADYGPFVCHGVDHMVETMAELHSGLTTTQHLIGSVLVEDAADSVRVRSHVRATLQRGRGTGGRVEVAACYRDVVVRTADGPRIAERRVEGRWVSGERSILPWFRERDAFDRSEDRTAEPRPAGRGHEGK